MQPKNKSTLPCNRLDLQRNQSGKFVADTELNGNSKVNSTLKSGMLRLFKDGCHPDSQSFVN